MNINSLGWNSFYCRALEPFGEHGLAGRVAMVHRGIYHVLSEEGEITASAAGPLYDEGNAPLVGDWVILQDRSVIKAVLPRKTVLERMRPGSAFGRQALAANIDVLLIVTGLDGDFSLRRIERYLVVAKHCGIEPLLVLSKADLLDPAQAVRAVHRVQALSPDARVVLWSAFDGSYNGALATVVGRGRTAALIGSSGVGKSTIVNRLLGEDVLATQPVRHRDDSGVHTTTRRQLIVLPQGWVLIDMPGLREVQLWAKSEDVAGTFIDIEELAFECRFSDCAHGEEPGCAVKDAIAAGSLDPDRLIQFHRLTREAAYLESQVDLSARLARKRRDKEIHRAVNRTRRPERR